MLTPRLVRLLFAVVSYSLPAPSFDALQTLASSALASGQSNLAHDCGCTLTFPRAAWCPTHRSPSVHPAWYRLA